MLSLEIFRIYRKLSVTKLANKANISRVTYYNALSGYQINPIVISRIDNALQLNGFLKFTYLFDRMYQMGIKISPENIIFPNNFPHNFLALFYTKHSLFDNNCSNNLYKIKCKIKKKI